MVRPPAYRISKYDAKNVGDVVKNRFDAQKLSMVSQYTASANAAAAIETSVGTQLDAWGVVPTLKPFYMAFIRKVGKILRTHSGITAHDEICLSLTLWVGRNFDPFYLATLVLDNYAVNVFDCT